MINNFSNYNKINEGYIFNVGDRVQILPKTADYIEEFEWPDAIYNTIGEIGTIRELDYEHDREAYFIEFENDDDDDDEYWYYFDDCIKIVDITPSKIKWYRKGKFIKDKMNESIEDPVFKFGDEVIVNNNLLEDIIKYKWTSSMKNLVGKKFNIRHVSMHPVIKKWQYHIKPGVYVFEESLDLVGSTANQKTQVRWYKGGKFTKDKINESTQGRAFNVGDEVVVNDNFLQDIIKYSWPFSLLSGLVGQKFTILRITMHPTFKKVQYYIKPNIYVFKESLDLVDSAANQNTKIRWYKGGKFTKDKLNESNKEPAFKVGDEVIVNNNIYNDIIRYGWSGMKRLIGKKFTILKIEKHAWHGRWQYLIEKNCYVYEESLDLVNGQITQVRWYKDGKFSKDKKTNESYDQPIFSKGDKVVVNEHILDDLDRWSKKTQKARKELIGKEGMVVHYLYHLKHIYDIKIDDYVYPVTQECLDLVDSTANQKTQVRWYKGGRFSKDGINESIKYPAFKVGDEVFINSSLLEDIIKYKWGDEMKYLVGKKVNIRQISRHSYLDKWRYYIKLGVYVFEESLDLVDSTANQKTQVRWYKGGRFSKDEKTNELFNGGRLAKALIKDLEKLKLSKDNGENIEVFYFHELKGFGKTKVLNLKNKILNKRVLFYYDYDRGIDGHQTRKEIMNVFNVDYQGFDFVSFRKAILLEGAPEIGLARSLYIDTKYPIAILPNLERRFTDNDPYGEELWQ